MFTQTAPSPPTLSSTESLPSPSSPTRQSRLRGLSYLRNYTQNHINPRIGSDSAQATGAVAAQVSGYPFGSQHHNSSSVIHSSQSQNPPAAAATVDLGQQGPSSGWLPTVGGRSVLSKVATKPQPTAANPPAAELAVDPVSSSPLDGAAMVQNRSESSPYSYRGLVPTHSAAAVEFARLDGPNSSTGLSRSTTGGGDSSSPADPQGQATVTESAPTVTEPESATATAPQVLLTGQSPSIRFVPHQDPRAARPSLHFQTVTRVLPDSSSVIRVGRYSEREDRNAGSANPNVSSAPVGFKSKVVSRRHCEFWCQSGQWYIKDVHSSSGTFLNHIRLSPPNVESKPFPVNDGDVVQLGIDFKGGEEMIFRCVKIRVECNRGWQQALNNFNMTTHKNLRNLAKGAQAIAKAGAKAGAKDGSTTPTDSSECSICLMSIAPCQSLFVAPCSHVWHYKCIRRILNGPTWPQFLCPNCRAISDLEAEVDEPEDLEDWMKFGETEDQVANGVPREEEDSTNHHETLDNTIGHADVPIINQDQNISQLISTFNLEDVTDEDIAQAIISQTAANLLARRTDNNNEVVPLDIAPRAVATEAESTRSLQDQGRHGQRSTTPVSSSRLEPGNIILTGEGPMTPRNDAGPFVFDGSAGRSSPRRISNIDAAAQQSLN